MLKTFDFDAIKTVETSGNLLKHVLSKFRQSFNQNIIIG